MRVKDLMDNNFVLVEDGVTLLELTRAFHANATEQALVINESHELCGLFTAKTVLDNLAKDISLQTKLADCPPGQFNTVDEDMFLDGEWNFKSEYVAVRDKHGKPVGVLSFFRFIAEYRKQAKFEALQELNKELEAVFDSSYDEIFVTDGNGITLRVSAACERLYGIKAADLIGRHVAELEKEKIFYPSLTSTVLKERKRITTTQKTRSGNVVICTGNPVFDNRGNINKIVYNSRDITELVDLQQRLQDTEQLMDIYRAKIMRLRKDKINSEEIITVSREMREVIAMSHRVAQVDSTVLIFGESGVGKGVVASAIHKNSKRSKGPFIVINCGAIPENLLESELFGYESGSFTGARKEGKQGLIQLAHGGTVFLDEVGELPLFLQVKLLHVIQDRQFMKVGGSKPIKVDVRIIAATNQNLVQKVQEGSFREDLYYRLNVIPITIPPLRNRKDDLKPLMNYFTELYNAKYEISKTFAEESLELLLGYNWPGNVREVENMVERLLVTTDDNLITPEYLPDCVKKIHESGSEKVLVQEICPLKEAVEAVEEQLLKKAYEEYGSTYKMAEALKVNQSTVVRKMKKHLKSL